MNASAEIALRVADSLECVGELSVEFVDAIGPAVGEGRLGQAPHPLVGVEVGRTGRQPHQVQAGKGATQLLDRGTAVDRQVVPDDEDVTPKVTQQMPEEITHLGATNVVAMETGVQAEPPTYRADRQPGDHRNAVAPIAMAGHRCLPLRCPGLEQGRDQLESALVDEDDVGTQPCGVFFTSGHVSRLNLSMACSSRSTARRWGFW